MTNLQKAEKMLDKKVTSLIDSLGTEINRELLKGGVLIFIFEVTFENEKKKKVAQLFKVKLKDNLIRTMRLSKKDFLQKVTSKKETRRANALKKSEAKKTTSKKK